MSDITLYEHPLNEKVRGYLRIEQLARELDHHRHNVTETSYKPFFNTLFALHEQIARTELRKELQKDLDRHSQNLAQWRMASDINIERLESLINQIDSYSQYHTPASRVMTPHHHDALLNSIKNKQALPGGGGSFETPQLHYWLHLRIEQQLADIERWCAPIQVTLDTVELMLHLLRESTTFMPLVAKDGFFQSSGEQSQLLRIKLAMCQGCYPTVSGHRNRYAIRFLPWEQQTPHHDIQFQLACC